MHFSFGILCLMISNTGILTVDLSAIQSNWLTTLAHLQTGCECAAVVKADAYSVGALAVAKALYNVGCKTFYLATVEEATKLREALASDVVLYVLGGVRQGSELLFIKNNLIPVLYSVPAVEQWIRFCVSSEHAFPCAIKVDTGMTRLGLGFHELKELLDRVDLNFLDPVLFMSHLACADLPAHPLNAKQRSLFVEALTLVRLRYPTIKASLANSSGSFLDASYHFDMVRIGAALYGINPQSTKSNPLRPVLNLKLPVLQIRTTLESVSVGYGADTSCAPQTKLAVVAGGYADGVHRSLGLSPRGQVNGITVNSVGRISMDSVVFDVTPLNGIDPDYIEVLNDNIDLNVLMSSSKTLGYEVLTSLGRRYKRKYISTDSSNE